MIPYYPLRRACAGGKRVGVWRDRLMWRTVEAKVHRGLQPTQTKVNSPRHHANEFAAACGECAHILDHNSTPWDRA